MEPEGPLPCSQNLTLFPAVNCRNAAGLSSHTINFQYTLTYYCRIYVYVFQAVSFHEVFQTLHNLKPG